jgi:hypothetical protein
MDTGNHDPDALYNASPSLPRRENGAHQTSSALIESPVMVFGSPNPPVPPPFSVRLPEQAAVWPNAPSTTATARRQLTPEEWESLKPTIFELYIKKNRPFKMIAEILRKEHNFFPT